MPEPDIIEGLSLSMTQAMNHYQCEECCCFVCGATNHFAQNCLHREAFCVWHKEHLNSKGVSPQLKEPTLKRPHMEVSACVATTHHASSLIANGLTVDWVSPETLVGLQVEGREVDALADSGSQVNTVTPGYVHQHEFPVLPLHDLVDHPLNLVGLGDIRTHPLGFVILRVQINEITGYNEDVVFLVVPDESEFFRHVPIVTGTCKLGRIINVIKESEMDRLLTPWAMVRASNLLNWWGTVVEDPDTAGDGPAEDGATAVVTQ